MIRVPASSATLSVVVESCEISPAATCERSASFRISLATTANPFPASPARHHVYAYVLRENSIMRFSDDREPQGTAGMPTLDAIRKNGCTDTAIVTIRYFGGTLLGTGGLVRAYSAAACGALNNANIITYDLYTTVDITVSYSDYQKITPLLSEEDFRVKDTRYMDAVTVNGSISSKRFEEFAKKITELTAGRGAFKKISENFEY